MEILLTDYLLQFITLLIFMWIWATFIAYIRSSRKMLSIELKSIIMWVMAGVLFFAIRMSLEFVNNLLIMAPQPVMSIVLNIFTISSALSFIISAYYLHRFSRRYGFVKKAIRKKKGKK
jgi:hypothetical protein